MGLSILPGVDCFLSYVREVFGCNLFKYFLRPFLSLVSFWDPYNASVCVFNVIPEVSETVLISFHSFSLFCSVAVISTTLSSSSLICSSASVILLLIPSSVSFLYLFIYLFILAALGLSCTWAVHCDVWASLCAGFSLVVVCRFSLSSCGAWAPEHVGSVVCSTWALLLRHAGLVAPWHEGS